MARKTTRRSRGYARPRVRARTARTTSRRRTRSSGARSRNHSSTLRIVVEQASQPVVGPDPRIIPVTPGKAKF